MNDNSWCFVLFLNIYMSATCQLLNMFWPFPLVFLLSSCNISLGTFLGSPAIMVSGLSPSQNLNQSVTTVDHFSVLEGCLGDGVVVGQHKYGLNKYFYRILNDLLFQVSPFQFTLP